MTAHGIRPKAALAIASLLALTCADFAHARSIPDAQAGIAVPASFDQAAPPSAAPDSAGDWWKSFGDPALDAVIERMHAHNTGIQQAAARLAAANARAGLGKASQMPFVGLSGSASHESGPLINKAGGSGNLFTGGLAVSWEADLLGRMSGERAAEKLDASASAAMVHDTRLLMEAATARAYFQTIYLERAAAEAASAASLWREREAIAEARMRGGLSALTELGALRQRRIASADQAADLARELAEARDTLAFLMGDGAPVSLAAQVLPAAPEVPPGVPAQVLARRSDVDAALKRLQAADKRLLSARRSWLPAFSLTASGGAASPALGELLASSARSFGLDLLFAIPLFDGGRHKARVAGNKAEADLAGAQYREAMLTALREVNDALAAVRSTSAQSRLADEALDLSQSEAAITAQRAQNGTASRALLIEAQLVASNRRSEALESQYQRLAAAIDMIKAIGGGWGGRAVSG